jgi:hypothetical protein
MAAFYQTRDQFRRNTARRVNITPEQLDEIAKILGIKDPNDVASLMLSATRREASATAAPRARSRSAAPRASSRRRQE